jgi:hypothetical protein
MEGVLTPASVIVEYLHLLTCQPWPGAWPNKQRNENELTPNAELHITLQWLKMFYGPESVVVSLPLEDPAGETLHCLLHQRRSLKSVEALIEAEQRLYDFRKETDARLEKAMGSCHGAIRHLLSNNTLRRTAPWVPSTNLRQPQKHEHVPISVKLHDVSKEVTGNFKKDHGKQAIQTINPPKQNQETLRNRPIGPVAHSLHHVDAEVYEVIKTFFRVPGDSDVPGNTTWTSGSEDVHQIRLLCREIGWICLAVQTSRRQSVSS